jgi:hypothetical protein
MVRSRVGHRLRAALHESDQPSHRAARNGVPLAVELTPDLPGAVDLEVLPPHTPNLVSQLLVGLRSGGAQRGIGLAALVILVGRRSDRQHLEDRLDSVLLSVVINEGDHQRGPRSSSA